MSTIDHFLKEAMDVVEAAKDLVGTDKNDAEAAAQALLAHAIKVVMVAKAIATPHKIGLTFFNTTLRYPEDCQAGYQMTDEDFRARFPYMTDRIDRMEPKFIGDDIWESSENCSDQGLDIFDSYSDFALTRGDRD